jgi:hypothetical protein
MWEATVYKPPPPVQPPFHVPLKSPDHQRIEFVYTFSHGIKNVCVYPLIKAAKTMGKKPFGPSAGWAELH